ncbi:unnamed protein product, partial [Symbiodinium sp. CCMP2592]
MKQKKAQTQHGHGHNKPVVKAQYRTRVTCGRVSGKVATWQGEEGWIRPDAKINHGLSSKNSGLVLVRRKDVSAGQALKPGEAVDFLVYSEVAEGGRLGAEFCRVVPGRSQPSPASQGEVGKPEASPVKPAQRPQKVLQLHVKKPEVLTLKKPEPPTLMKPVPKKGGKPKGATVGKSGKPSIQNVITAGKDGKKSGAATTPGKGPPASVAKGFNANSTAAPGPPSADGFKAKHKLPRQQIGDAEQSGQLHEWWGKYGWIIPDKPVNHPGASKRQGKVYVHLSDMEDDSVTVIPGCRVSFLLYVDNSGLGAQSCRILDNLPGGKGFQNAPKTGYNKWQSTGYQQANNWQSQSQEAQEEEGLPPDWEEHWSDEYNVPYFWNKQTKEFRSPCGSDLNEFNSASRALFHARAWDR